MFDSVLFVHSWFRWILFFGIIYFLVRSLYGWLAKKPWTDTDAKFVWAFDQIFGYQILFGLVLWLVGSPLTKAMFADPSIVMHNKVISFFSFRHGVTMILALGVLHMGKAKAKKSSEDKRFKIFAIIFGVIFILVMSAIPWPGLAYGRDLFRWFI
jgi:hypothetical protein